MSYIELDKDLEVDKVCDIFTQISSRGIRLDVFDLVNALLKPKGLQLKKLWRDAASRLDGVETEKMNVYILQVMSILRQGYCSPKYLYFLLPGQEKSVRDPAGARRKEILIPNIADFESRWNSAVDALEGAIKVLKHPQEYGAVSSAFLPYVSILPVFAALRAYGPFVRGAYADATFAAFRQLEVRVGNVGGSLTGLLGRKLMDEAFKVPGGPLTDMQIIVAEQESMRNIFNGSIGLFKNPHSHRHVPTDAIEAAELVGFASYLMRILDRLIV